MQEDVKEPHLSRNEDDKVDSDLSFALGLCWVAILFESFYYRWVAILFESFYYLVLM